MTPHHLEPFLVLAGLTEKSVLISWGAFFFEERAGRWHLVDDENLRSRVESIGARSSPYGQAVIEIRGPAGEVAARHETDTCNHAWIDGLEPDTEYEYRVLVDGKPWAEEGLRDWERLEDGSCGLVDSDRRYCRRFRTYPHPDTPAPLSFAVIGDYGVGIGWPSENGERQRRVGKALEKAVDEFGIRLLLTTGDNIYYDPEHEEADGTGEEDDDWYFTYYQPYRYLLSRVPVYPSVGNHDSGETENSDDRQQLADNFFIDERFVSRAEIENASFDPGLFYRFVFGKDVEFVCIDTSEAVEHDDFEHFFEHGDHQEFLGTIFQEGCGKDRWVIPFSHHPPWCAGPHHCNNDKMIEHVVPHLRRACVRVMFCGHEHNFQYNEGEGLHCFVSGAGGKLRPELPGQFEQAHTRAWARQGHFLHVRIEGRRMEVQPYCRVDEGGRLEKLRVEAPDGTEVGTPFVVQL